MTQIPTHALIVVADGGGAKLFRNTGKVGEIVLKDEENLSPKSLADEGPSGSRPGDQTPSQTDEATFAKQLAQKLFKMHEAKKFTDLVLIADATTLGTLRGALHKSVEASVVTSLSKDYTNLPTADIVKALS